MSHWLFNKQIKILNLQIALQRTLIVETTQYAAMARASVKNYSLVPLVPTWTAGAYHVSIDYNNRITPFSIPVVPEK